MKIRPRDSRHLRRLTERWWEIPEAPKKFGKLAQLNKHGKVPHYLRSRGGK